MTEIDYATLEELGKKYYTQGVELDCKMFVAMDDCHNDAVFQSAKLELKKADALMTAGETLMGIARERKND